MSKKTSIPQNIPLPPIPKLSKKKIKKLKNYKLSEEKKAYIHEKYEKPLQERERNLKRKKRSDWWKTNWVSFLAMIFAFIAAIPYIIQGIETILEWLTQWNL